MKTQKCELCGYVSRGINAQYLADEVRDHMAQHDDQPAEYWGNTESPDEEAFPARPLARGGRNNMPPHTRGYK
jgi:hypothetical protein